jgi:hypothetical protein
MPTINPVLRDKIERRSRRAWRSHRRGDDRRFSRITDVTDRTLMYRLPGGPSGSANWYGDTKVIVRRKNGEIHIEEPPRDPLLTLISKFDLSKLERHNGRVRAFKYTTKEGKSPTRTGPEALTYQVGDVIEVVDADTDKSADCSYGINLGTQDWIKKNRYGENRVFACEFEIEDLAAVPSGSDGKFRVFKCEVMEELDPTSFRTRVPPPPPTKIIKPIQRVEGDPLTQPLADRIAARKRKLADRKQKAMEQQKFLPAPIPKPKPERTPESHQLPPPEKAAKKGRPGWIERIWKRLGF